MLHNHRKKKEDVFGHYTFIKQLIRKFQHGEDPKKNLFIMHNLKKRLYANKKSMKIYS